MTTSFIDAARTRPLGPGRIVWLTSYPKSGNTWMRAIATALTTHPHLFAVDHLTSGAQPYSVTTSLALYGLDARWLSYDETDRVRTSMLTAGLDAPVETDDTKPAAILRKTHEVYRPGKSGAEPFPTAVTRAAILIVRDPRDVACSYAPFFGTDLDSAIDALATVNTGGRGNPAMCETSQPWGSWSTHTRSWLADDVPFPVHLVRYEDVRSDPVATLEPVFRAVGIDCTHEQLTDAVEQARFERLRASEEQFGFRETNPRTKTFFRSGRAGGWREELSADQVATIELDHRDVMGDVGYELTTTPPRLTPLPVHLGLRVRLGTVPEELEGGESPLTWIHTTKSATIVQFGPGKALMVNDGRRVTLQWPEDDDDLSWVLQGWAVAIATLQRGDFSLHASTVEIGDRIVAIAGRSGAGKSTTCMALRNRGHRLLVDDTTLLRFRDGHVFTTPYSRNVHLLPDSAEALGLDFAEFPRLAGGRVKASFTPDEPPVEPRRIDRIVVLDPSPDCEAASISEVRGLQRLNALREHVARSRLAPTILGHDRHFQLITDLADAVPVFVLTRPTQGWTLDEVVALIEKD